MSNNKVMERLERYGFDTLNTSDQIDLTLELIGYHGSKVPFQSLDELFNTPHPTLLKYFDSPQILKLLSINRLSSAWMLEKINATPLLQFKSPSDATDFFVKRLSNESVEKLGVLFLNTRNSFIDYEVLSVGTKNRATVHPGEIAKAALLKNCAAVVISHNHPGGDPSPSAQDIEITTKVGAALKTIDVTLLDHIIVAGKKDFSFAENNLDLIPSERSVNIEV